MICGTLTGTHAHILVHDRGSTQCSPKNSSTVDMLRADFERFALVRATCEGVRRGTRVTKLTSFQAHVSLKHLPCCLAKFRAWPTGLTWQGKHKPGDELSAQTRYQNYVLRFRHVCWRWCRKPQNRVMLMKPHDVTWYRPCSSFIIYLTALWRIKFCILKIIWEAMKWIGLYPRLLKLHQCRP